MNHLKGLTRSKIEELSTDGYHFIVELSGCNHYKISDPKEVLSKAYESCNFAELDIVGSYVVKFKTPYGEGEGASIFIVLEQSHFSAHTWPEKRYVSVDAYSCGDGNFLKPIVSVLYFAKELDAESIWASYIERGFPKPDGFYHEYIHYADILEKKLRKPTSEELEEFKKSLKLGHFVVSEMLEKLSYSR